MRSSCRLSLLAAAAVAVAGGCDTTASDPFVTTDAGVDVADEGSSADSTSESDNDDDAGAALGKPCMDDQQCDDGVPCTLDSCDPDARRCRNVVDDEVCQNARYCDGVEKCDPSQGCVPGEPITCSDADICTIDRCVEESRSCSHELRDADGDGDPDIHCKGGDCDDNDPLVNSNSEELCGNLRDDDCDGVADETDCVHPANDTCSDPVVLTSGQPVELSTGGATSDYGASCVIAGDPTMRDIVAAVVVPDGPAMDVEVLVKAQAGQVWAAAPKQCGDASLELGCSASHPTGNGSLVARFIARQVPPGPLPIYVFSNIEQRVMLQATLRAPQPPASNETCGTAQPIVPGIPFSAELIDVARDLATDCAAGPGELVYSFSTTEAHDVRIYASSVDGLGQPIISLRSEACVGLEDELACRSGNNPVVFRRAIPPGSYYVALSATAGTTVQATVALSPPTSAPADEVCEGAPLLEHGQPVQVSLADHTDDIPFTCMNQAVDAAYALPLNEPSDVLLVQRSAPIDQGAVALFGDSCDEAGRIACVVAAPSPVRLAVRGLPAGSYHAVVETLQGTPAQLTAFVRPAAPTTYVLFADTCEQAVTIPPGGGLFQGNTKNATAQYAAGCDQAGGAAYGGADQLLRLELTEARRVVLDMQGSSYRTLLNVRRGPACPGAEMVASCAVGYFEQRSFLDLRLDPGTYFVQIDGFYGESGPWLLDVHLSEP